MQRIDRAVLEKPFPFEAIKSRRGPHGQELSYVEGAMYIQRLNDAFGSAWNWEIVRHEQCGTDLVVRTVRLRPTVRSSTLSAARR